MTPAGRLPGGDRPGERGGAAGDGRLLAVGDADLAGGGREGHDRRGGDDQGDRLWSRSAPLASMTWTVTVKLPAAVGVPLSRPVEAFRVSPAGRVPLLTDQTKARCRR